MHVATLIGGGMIQHPRPANTQMEPPQARAGLGASIEAAWQQARRFQPLAYAADAAHDDFLYQAAQHNRALAEEAQEQRPTDPARAQKVAALGTETLAFLTALTALGWSDLPAVAEVFQQNGHPVSDAARPIFARHPALQRWDERRMAVAAAHDAGVAAGLERRRAAEAEQAAEMERQAPARLLAALRGRGIALGVDAKGAHLTAAPAGAVTPEELDGLRQHKPALLALLRAEAEAAKPVVVA